MLQCVAVSPVSYCLINVCCSVLQCVLQCVVMCVAVCVAVSPVSYRLINVCCSVLQCVLQFVLRCMLQFVPTGVYFLRLAVAVRVVVCVAGCVAVRCNFTTESDYS